MNRGFKITGNGHRISIEKASMSYTSDQCIKSSDRELIGLEIEPGKIEYASLHIGSTHNILGHPSNDLTYLAAEKMGLKRIHMKATCESCIKAKQKQDNVPKYIDFKADEPGGKVSFNLSSIKYKRLGGAKFWLLLWMSTQVSRKSTFYVARIK